MSNDTQPEIRFPGFTDDWEQRKFEDSFNFPVSTNSLSRAMLNYDRGEVKSVHYGDVLIKYPAILNVKTAQIPFINNGTRENFKSNLLKNGDLIFADAAEDESVGKAVEVNALTDEYLVSGLHTIVARPKGKMAEFFLGYYINSEIYHRQLLRLMQGTKVSAISKKNLLETEVSFPTRIEEQEKIGNFFKQLDDTIALHQRKLDLLKETKKGFLQKMFPKNGAKVPEIRFPGFTEDWEQRKLGQVANYRRGSFPQPYGNKEWYDGENSMPFVQVVDVGDNLRLVDDTKQKISELAQPKSVFVEEGKVVVTLQGSIGRVAITQYPAYVDRTLLIFESYKAEMDEYYFAYVIQQLFEYEKTRAPGGTIKTITKEALSNFTISFPSIAEQKKLGKFFEQLDDTIALHQRKLDLLKETKKGFLQKMFV
ncbi:restriction endonuclease subunit S [Enterococcus gallinarum]|uniref:restriction endonuclease subunit S n=1 Tax=Enterococcus gallinarum TaxID=1353 RepID=UPI0028FD1F81|nr:restriction endonuclease subunit S [Enterococcus gallinarum]GMS52926.1 restriction endonuclease subunit S [Enterococcus gallinarum]